MSEKEKKTVGTDTEAFRALAAEVAQFRHVYAAAVKEVQTKLEILDEEFRVKYAYNPIHHIESRLKTTESIYKKIQRRGYPVQADSIRNNVYDIAGIRVTCHYIDDIDQIAKMLLKQSDVALLQVKDYVREPKPNGYRSLHIVVKIPVFLSESVEYVPVEVQIRTIAMDFWASLEHRLKYKSDDTVTADLAARLKACAEDINRIDREMQSIKQEISDSPVDPNPYSTIPPYLRR